MQVIAVVGSLVAANYIGGDTAMVTGPATLLTHFDTFA